MNEKEIKKYLLSNPSALKEVVEEVNTFNGTLELVDFYENTEVFFEYFFGNNVKEAVRCTQNENYSPCDKYVVFTSYNTLRSYTEEELMKLLVDEIDYIVENLLECSNELVIQDKRLKELL